MLNSISVSIPKIDHLEKANGTALYVCDYDASGMLHGRILRSSTAKGIVRNVRIPELPNGYYYVDSTDIPGKNQVHMIQDDTPVFTNNVQYIGEPIGMLVGPDLRKVSALLREVEVEYEVLTPVFDAQKSEDIFFNFNIDKGDIDSAFSQADKIIEGNFETGLQEHIYLETNGMIGKFKDGKLLIHGSLQCPYYVHGALVDATALAPEDVIVKQDVTGGGFGGKEDFPSALACQVAIAALKAGGKSVRVVFEREEDIIATSKRHPSFCNYKIAVKDEKVTGMIADILVDGGAYTTMSMVVLQRATIGASGVYNIENIKVRGYAKKTNTVPNGAFRGFGGPQVFFAIEMMMTHVAKELELDIDSAEFKLNHIVKQGDLTSTSGKYHFPVPIKQMADKVLQESDYFNKKKQYQNQIGRFRKGIGFSLVFHGAGFTGNGERDIIKAVARLKKTADDKVEILTANTDMGQGLATTFTKIVAKAMDLPLDKVIIALPDTSKVPNSGPTVASRSIMVVGELLRRAAMRLKEEWIKGKEFIVEEHYKHPSFMIPFDLENFKGDAYPTYSWQATVAETNIDTLTGNIEITDVWGSFDVGTPIDENIVIGQMEGGIIQSLGYAIMEKCTIYNGAIGNKKLCDYIIPTALDFPSMNVFLHVDEYPEGPFGAKGAGEMSHVGGAPAVLDAIQNALEANLNKIPFMPEDVLETLRKEKTL
ncbi:MAG: xanthine dehydrogenase family protein molybdopterin-binding subunit [Oscillospiraceae bacterium]|nr:xanthine dehydrogenase family protein molybdopterin-binding subunit [Oscillospiraceae bacterium]